MLKASLRKIKSAHSNKLVIAVAVMAAVVLLAVISFVRHQNQGTTPYSLRLKTGTYHLEAATTAAEQEKGLGDRQSMAVDHGMTFVFDNDNRHCFWMKDTHFALDMIWVSSTKKVTAIEKNVAPDTYPTVFCHEGRYVIELNAGAADLNKLVVNQQLYF
jgi:uncharacterized membrane protein (UPF0127 family)